MISTNAMIHNCQLHQSINLLPHEIAENETQLYKNLDAKEWPKFEDTEDWWSTKMV
jgi:hypothetical protein